MTVPEENDTRSPLLRLSLAALAVRALALVATFMPMYPESPVKKPPVTKANGAKRLTNPLSAPSKGGTNASAQRITNTTAKNFTTAVYCRFMYAFAPVRIASAIFTIFSLPSEYLRTLRLCTKAKTSANAAPKIPSQKR
jgi:hypothetical protein